MQTRYVFREIKREEIPLMFQMILERMRWMDKVGIEQWNVTKYDEVYPLSYYEEKQAEGEIFVLEDTEVHEIVCAAALKTKDDRWEEDGIPAFYLHHFVTKIDAKGCGAIFLDLAEQYALKQGKVYFRLDSADDNFPLERYYTAKGYLPVGHCVDGLYTGILRQKKLF